MGCSVCSKRTINPKKVISPITGIEEENNGLDCSFQVYFLASQLVEMDPGSNRSDVSNLDEGNFNVGLRNSNKQLSVINSEENYDSSSVIQPNKMEEKHRLSKRRVSNTKLSLNKYNDENVVDNNKYLPRKSITLKVNPCKMPETEISTNQYVV